MNDSMDLAVVSMAVPYCDVVVTEKFWGTLVHRHGFDSEYGTEILHDVAELPDVLVSL